MPVVGGLRITKRRTQDISPVNFSINGKPYSIHGEYDLTTSLNDFLRDGAGLRGTKVMCREGGCGCCAVTVTQTDPVTGQDNTFSINSCLCPLYSVDGWQITTVEGLGSQRDGFHPIQERIANFSGSQCGYCTPGMVMNMYGLLHKNVNPSQEEIEDQFGGNICRCTGYRPILEAMRSFAKDSTIPGSDCIDIEDLNKHLCPRTGKPCDDHGDSANGSANGASANGSSANGAGSTAEGVGFRVHTGGKNWYRPQTLKALVAVLQSHKGSKVRLLYGNTASGIYKNDGPFDVFVDLRDIKELGKVETTPGSVKFGSSLTLSRLMDELGARAGEKGYAHFTHIVAHLNKIGNILVRNAGTWAGNLMIKHVHPEFPSDVFIVMEAAGARLFVLDSKDGSVKSQTLTGLVTDLDMKGKVILSIGLPAQDEKVRFRSYKIMPRAQNTHAHVNAGFRVTLESGSSQVLGKPSLVFGGISKDKIHATKTEDFLTGKILTDTTVLKTALESLRSELKADVDPVLASVAYRRHLAVNLFYKFVLNICEPKTASLASGGQPLDRPLSTATQEYEQKASEFPLKEPMPKLASPLQASGEVEFVNDIPSSVQELCGAFVVSTVGRAAIDRVDPTAALVIPGVVDYVSIKDIPEAGQNDWLPPNDFLKCDPEEVFSSGELHYAGQPVGFIVAESQTLADEAAELVKITYKDVQKPITCIADAIQAESYHANPMMEHKVGDPDDAMVKASKTVTGETTQHALYHFYMENQVSLSVPCEDRLDVYTACQGTDIPQAAIAQVLGKPNNYINVTTPRVGGAFGGKALNSVPVAVTSALAAYKLKRPVKTSVNMATNMAMLGKRYPVYTKYKVGFDESGHVSVVDIDIYCDCGYTANLKFLYMELLSHIDGAYHIPNWRVKVILCKTNKPTSQPMRGPGPYPAGFIIEGIMEHVAKSLNKSPVDVKELNLYKEGEIDIMGHELKKCNIRKVWTELRQSANVDRRTREIQEFNKAHQWKKRGLTMTPVKYGFHYMGAGLTVDVAIYATDGTVTVSTGGVEMGQGLYTKMAQAVASSLGIPLSFVRVRPVNSHISPNNTITGGSVGSEFTVQSALNCCEILNERIAPIRAKHADYDWKNLIKTCDLSAIELSAKHKWAPKKHDGPGVSQYFSWAAGVAETELDVLTGENQIRRVDINFDCGESLNPTIDIGQIEGAYVMGIGGYLLEEVLYDKATGRVLNDGTWEYKPPTAKDIPIDWRIQLVKDTPNPAGIRGSKASGEPPIVLTSGVLYSLKHAMEEAREQLTGSREYQAPVAPLTVERLQLGCGFAMDKMVL